MSDHLCSALFESVNHIDELIALLHEERTAMEARDTATMQVILPQKSRLLEQLQRHAKTRADILVGQGLTPDESGLKHYLQQTLDESQADAIQAWETLKAKLEECKQENAINAKIIHRSKHHLDQLIDIIKGQQGQSLLYSEKGVTRSSENQQPIAKA